MWLHGSATSRSVQAMWRRGLRVKPTKGMPVFESFQRSSSDASLAGRGVQRRGPEALAAVVFVVAGAALALATMAGDLGVQRTAVAARRHLTRRWSRCPTSSCSRTPRSPPVITCTTPPIALLP